MNSSLRARLLMWLAAALLIATCSLTVYASFSPPSAVPYNATAYASRVSPHNITGMSSLAAYASPAACPVKVNLFSQDVTCSVPVLSLLGRAGLNLGLGLAYNSKVWILSGSTIYFDGDKGWPAPGWRLGFGRIDGVYAGGDGYNHYYYIANDGGVHDLRYNSSDSLYESIDSTYMDFNDSTGVLRMKDGTQMTFALQGGTGGYVLPTQIKDRNGNYITVSYSGTGQNISSITDTIGRTVSFSYNGDGTLASISAYGFGAVNRTWSFGYTSVTLSYSFASSLTVNGPSSGSSVKLLTSITYPNSTEQTFTYNGYGQMTEADFLSSSSTVRGKFLTSWQSAPGGGWTDSPTPSQVGNYDGTNTNNWSLAFNTYSTTVTDPTSVTQTTTFLQTGGWDDGLPNQTQIGSTAVKTIADSWGNDGNSINQRLTSVTTTLNDTNQQSEVAFSYTTYGNVNEADEYDYGLTLARKTVTAYNTSSNYTSAHILSLPGSVTEYDGSGNKKSYKTFTYDSAALVSATGASGHDDSNYGTSFAYRGLVTTVTAYTDPVTPSGAISHNSTYDMLGNMRTADADCCVQDQFAYSSTTQYSQPDSVTRGSSGTTLTASATYDASTGLKASSTDENNQQTSYSYDSMDRLTSATRPDTTVLSTSYDDSSASPGKTATTPITGSTSRKTTTTFDGLNRKTRITILDASSNVYSKVDTQYDALGRVYQVSVPYTGSSASYWYQNQYDALNRVTKTIPPDGSPSSNNISFSYSGNTITATDQTGKQRKTITDAFGRPTEVDEPDPSNNNSLTLTTTSTYDPLNNLTQTSQGVQTRSYVFDGLGRETSETTPEAGTVSYVYNSYSKMTQRTDARGVVTTYSYDGLNRPYQVSYNTTGTTAISTPTITYSYGTSSASYNNGGLLALSDGLGSETYSYDLLGRRTQVQKVIYNVTYSTAYTYNLNGGVVNLTYPSGRVVTNTYDAIGRMQGVKNNSTSANYISSVAYNSAHQVTGFTFGNNVSASFGYTAQRSQLSSINYTQGSTTLFGLSYGYTQNNGNDGEITSITDNVDSGRTASYTYDALGRLLTASTNGSSAYPAWGLSWTYDRYGNRTAQTVTAGSPTANSVSVSTSTNQITSSGSSSFSYDANGNLTQDDIYVYKYDAENRLVEMDGISDGVVATYAYDGNSVRTVKVWGADRTYYLYSGSQLLSEFEDASSNTYTAGTTPGTVGSDSVALIMYQHPDHLSTRIATDNSGNYAASQARYPFGDAWYGASWLATASVTRKFTSYYLDTEAGAAQNNYALARVHGARFGRFFMADPVRGTQKIPQRLNRYAYVENDPVNRVDPTGRDSFFCEPCKQIWAGRCYAELLLCVATQCYNPLVPFLSPSKFLKCAKCQVNFNLCNAQIESRCAPYCDAQPGPPWPWVGSGVEDGGGGGGGGGDRIGGRDWGISPGNCDPSSDDWLSCVNQIPIGVPSY